MPKYATFTNARFIRTLASPSRALCRPVLPSGATPYPLFAVMTMNEIRQPRAKMHTDILPIDPTKIGQIVLHDSPESLLDEWDLKWEVNTADLAHMKRAAAQLRSTDIPVAFPTETVYGLGADATRSTAVQGIFQVKQRPSDNPLIVHVCSIQQLKEILRSNGSHESIPAIYQPLIQKFWPGPLTIILPNPKESPLAPEVTAGLSTFGARMPRSLLALVLIKLAGVPLAAPSANASTRPSPTAAEHVKDDLDGRIEMILDGGPCDVGVESTVVDGLTHPPSILRPGGISIEKLRKCPGWENVVVGYKDAPEKGIKPRAPGMKYRHYSPKAPVILYEAGAERPTADTIREYVRQRRRLGIIRTKSWPPACGLSIDSTNDQEGKVRTVAKLEEHVNNISESPFISSNGNPLPLQEDVLAEPGFVNLLQSYTQHRVPVASFMSLYLDLSDPIDLWEISLGREVGDIARGLFSALRELDKYSVDAILVEGINDDEGDIATAVMNRLRKAAEVRV